MMHNSYCSYLPPDTANMPHVMGILNITPDSFSDGGKHNTAELALKHANQMIAEGANILDIGAESTRPGSKQVTLEDEWERLTPVLEPVIALGTPVSIDTYKAEIARRACLAGAVIINDVWGLQKDPAMADVVKEADAHVIMMHNKTHTDPDTDILSEIHHWFEASMSLAQKAGIPEDKQILDPGFGFGKTLEQNYTILDQFDRLTQHGLPILAGASRKRMIGSVLGAETDDRLYGSLAVHLLAMQKGATLVRVHDVRPHVDAARILHAMRQGAAS